MQETTKVVCIRTMVVLLAVCLEHVNQDGCVVGRQARADSLRGVRQMCFAKGKIVVQCSKPECPTCRAALTLAGKVAVQWALGPDMYRVQSSCN